MYSIDSIKKLHIEISQNCNASCPVCNRNLSGGPTLPWLNPSEISISQFQQYFDVDFIAQLNSLLLCGSYGDPIMAKDLVAIVSYVRETNPGLQLKINTNGGMRSSDFWQQLGSMMPKPSHVTFSIDGLEDTNSIYRRNVNWKRLMNSVQSYIQAGGAAKWEFLVFKHNQHQIVEARALAERLGFQKFILKKPFGFSQNGKNQVINVFKKDGGYDYAIQSSTIAEFSQSNSDISSASEHLGDFQNYRSEVSNIEQIEFAPEYAEQMDALQVHCKSVQQNELYVDARGNVFPCCYTGSRLYSENLGNPTNRQLQKFYQTSPANFSLREQNLKEIIDSDLFQKKYPQSWKCSISEGRLAICAEFCGS